MLSIAILNFLPEPSTWDVWAPHTWAPWLSLRLFRAGLFVLGAFLLDRAWRSLLRRLKTAALRHDKDRDKDLEQRLETLSSVAHRTGSLALWIAAFLMILADFGVQVGPLVAGLGIVGVAVGFGAQFLVRDLINGLFLVAEDQFRVGDWVKLEDFSGTVEGIALRTTMVRSLGGELHTIPNGEIRSVTNYSRHWSRAVLDVGLAQGSDLSRAFDALREAGDRARKDVQVAGTFLESPEVVGVTELGDSAIRVRIWAKVAPGKQWEVERVLRKAVAEVFSERGMHLPVPKREVALDGPSLEALRGREG